MSFNSCKNQQYAIPHYNRKDIGTAEINLLMLQTTNYQKVLNYVNQSSNQSINHGFLEWPKYLKHC